MHRMSEGENDDGMFGFTNYSETKQIRHEINRHIFLFNEKYPLHPSPPPEELQLKFKKSNRQMFLLFGNYQRKSLFQDKLNQSMTWKKERKGLVCFLNRWRKCLSPSTKTAMEKTTTKVRLFCCMRKSLLC